MERDKRKRVDVELLLPDPIIQDIQSCLTKKEAAQTTVLSKAWYRAWSTRPHIDLDYQRNGGAPIVDPFSFSEHAKQTVRRYEEQNLKVESFRLCMGSSRPDPHFIAGDLVARAMKLGAKDVNIEFRYKRAKKHFILPHEVLGSMNLSRLSVTACTIVLGGKISCPNLKFLSFSNVYVRRDVVLDIITSCPSIEGLSLSRSNFLYGNTFHINVTRHLDLGHYGVGALNKSITLHVFNHLTSLLLCYVKVDSLFIQGFSSKFPCLKDLTLSHSLGPKKIHISSVSIEFITIDQTIMLRARIDVPNLRRFTLSSSHLPSLTFGVVSGEWESFVSFRNLDNSLFRHFTKFLSVMKPSKLNLVLYLTSCWRDSFDSAVGFKCGPVVENLTINVAALEMETFWDGLFFSCRPKFITTSYSSIHDWESLDVAYMKLVNVDGEFCGAYRSVLGQYGLNEANAEVFDEPAAEWKPLSLKTLLDDLLKSDTSHKIRFHLRWDK